jgi:hypothetical protein
MILLEFFLPSALALDKIWFDEKMYFLLTSENAKIMRKKKCTC